MVNPSKANALNSRANDAVDALTKWAGYLHAELGKQRQLESGSTSKYAEPQYPETIELKRRDIELLADALRHNAHELRRFTRPD